MFNYKRVARLEQQITDIHAAIHNYMCEAEVPEIYHLSLAFSPSERLKYATERLKKEKAEAKRRVELRAQIEEFLAQEKAALLANREATQSVVDGCKFHTQEDSNGHS